MGPSTMNFEKFALARLTDSAEVIRFLLLDFYEHVLNVVKFVTRRVVTASRSSFR